MTAMVRTGRVTGFLVMARPGLAITPPAGRRWGAHDSNTVSLSASLANFWPTPLVPTGSMTAGTASASASGSGADTGGGSANSGGGGPGAMPPLGELVAHSGVAAMARELLPTLLPHIRGAADAGAEHVVFAGHSLGGSLAKLIWALSILQGHRSPEASSCHSFGSPPVLAHASGGGGARVLRVLRAPPAACLNWVLEHDPVPRAMLTADPYFAAARAALPGLSALLSLRGALLGEGAALSSGRFLYETVGELLLLRWASKGGCEVVPVSEADAESLLKMALDEATTAPVRTLQYWLDHHHASYHHDLETAALAACRREARSGRSEAAPQAGAGVPSHVP
ncbi:hypothetical protein GPECTOR_23g118 [Gonium pectorale]|uniref:Fungal lipase-type domain-containing protein n=1 Tax=Gonium pectorale TaxID=33097 RepID=A0A150GI40_GONPE|nr:hypothetical protein GPECTOR_23g118 [Gonium pectorale]|eukprot:KXZ49030.1 hypothetical protein GPECTOR_23g118 [Gonium pectorale]